MKCIFFCLIFLLSLLQLNAQDLKTYEVGTNETLEDVASRFNVDVFTIRQLNPHVDKSNDISRMLLVVPATSDFNLNPKVKLITYEVSPKETLYSISKSYNVKIKDLKAYNPFLKERELNYNDVLRIPAYELKDKDLDINQSVKNSKFNTLKHLVLPKETKYGISRKYGLTIEQLVEFNPEISEKEIQPGQFLTIKRPFKNTFNQPYKEKKEYSFVKIDASNSIESISETYNVTEEELEESNPSLKFEGFSEGLILKIPQYEEIKSSRFEAFNLEDNLNFLDTKRIALMLPLNLEKTEIDSLSSASLIKNSNLLRISLEFYEGIEMAIDSARAIGIDVDLEVYDTRNSPAYVRQQLTSDFRNYEAVVGPLLDPSLKVVTEYLSQDSIPVISPLVNPKFEYNNLFSTLPKEEQMQELLITYLQKNLIDQNLVILTDSISRPVQRKFTYTFPDIKVANQSDEEEYLQKSDIEPLLDKSKVNWFILETQTLGTTELTISYLNSLLRDGYKIRLFSSKRNSFYEDEISNFYLSDLKFTFPSIAKTQLLASESDEGSYSTKHGLQPSKYVIRGYDVMMDVILRLAFADSLKGSTGIEGFTEYHENKFNYIQGEFSLGYENDAIYLLQYDENLEIKSLDLAEFLATDTD